MTGRGIDQILPHPCSPELREPYVDSAIDYVVLAEQVNGPIPRPVDSRYIWGDALQALADAAPDIRIINLETAITSEGRPFPKPVNYRMHPQNTPILQVAAIDCCVLANNHVLDWGETGLRDTLRALAGAGIQVTGAGDNRAEAERPASIPVDNTHRVLVFAFGTQDSGVPLSWAATQSRPGVAVLPDLSVRTAGEIARRVMAEKLPGDVVLVSIHWGSNWGYEIPPDHRQFAHALLDHGCVDIVHGHSSHHPKAIELYRNRLVLYGCGDLINDYEGIRGYETYRDDLSLLYLPTVDSSTGELQQLEMIPLQIRNFRLNHASAADRDWLCRTLDRECGRYGGRVLVSADRLRLA